MTAPRTDPIIPAVKRFHAITLVERSTDPGIDASATITTDAVDREGDIVNPKGMRPIPPDQKIPVLYGHDHASLPIGVATAFAVGERGIRAGWRWLKDDPFAQRVRNAWDQEVLNAVSIGFLPKKATPIPGGRGLRFDEWELIEFSVVPSPANPQAHRAFRKLGLEGSTSCAQVHAYATELDTQLRQGKTLSDDHARQLQEAIVVIRTLTQAESTPPTAPDVAVLTDDGSVIRIAPQALAAAVKSVTKAEIDIAFGRIPDDEPIFATRDDEPVITLSNQELAELVREGLQASVRDALLDLTGRID